MNSTQRVWVRSHSLCGCFSPAWFEGDFSKAVRTRRKRWTAALIQRSSRRLLRTSTKCDLHFYPDNGPASKHSISTEGN